MTAPHWIVRVMNCVSDPAWWDGLILGTAAGLLLIGLPLLWWLQ